MAHHQRGRSGTASGPHSISLKVLRLSRPSLTAQTPLASTITTTTSVAEDDTVIPPSASLAHPSADPTSSFPLTPLLTLPAAFGAAYVGETFMCTLCANNELPPTAAAGGEVHRRVSGLQVVAELQTPSAPEGVKLEFVEAVDEKADEKDENGDLPPGGTLQRTLRHELKDEGPHVLAVTVTYTEATVQGGEEGREVVKERTFRKLYQFAAQPIIAVRSKVTERKRKVVGGRVQWVLEAQLENVGESSVVLEEVSLREHEGVRKIGGEVDGLVKMATVLKPQDVEQVMFALEAGEEYNGDKDTRQQLAQVSVTWRSSMGETGHLTTGWLLSRGR